MKIKTVSVLSLQPAIVTIGYPTAGDFLFFFGVRCFVGYVIYFKCVVCFLDGVVIYFRIGFILIPGYFLGRGSFLFHGAAYNFYSAKFQ